MFTTLIAVSIPSIPVQALVSFLIAILVLGFLVIVHEAGHFLVARWVGVRVLRFSMGFGPRLLAWTRGHTEYAISLIPLGGYVKMAGEQPEEGRTHQPWEYLSKPISVRAAIIFAGPGVNYLVALLSLWLTFIVGYPELLPVVGGFAEGMPAQTAGLQPGDRIAAIDDTPVKTWEEMTDIIERSAGKPLTLTIDRSGENLTIPIVPQAESSMDPLGEKKQVGRIGIKPSGAFETVRLGPVEAIPKTLERQAEWIVLTFKAFGAMASGKLKMKEAVTGPIGLVYLTSEAVNNGIAPLLFLMSLFSLSLAIFNLFPIPILDGGHLFFLLLEKLRGAPVSLIIQERAAQVSLVLLVSFALMVCVNDLSRYGLVQKMVEWVKP